MSVYLFSVLVTFIMINIAESYRCGTLSAFEFLANTVVSFIPGLNAVVAVYTVHMAINK